MKRHLTPVLLLSFTFLGSLPSALAAPSTSARDASLAAALQAVSPDPLGGQLGLVVASRIVAPKPAATSVALARLSALNSAKTRPATPIVANARPRP